MHTLQLIPLVGLAVLATGCPAKVKGGRDNGLIGLELTKVEPQTILPGTHLQVTGRSFVDTELGSAELVLAGTLDEAPFDLRVPAKYVSSSELGVDVDADFLAQLGGTPAGLRNFKGTASVEYLSTVDQGRHSTPTLEVALGFQGSLTPDIFAVGDGVVFVNQPVLVDGSRFLLGTGEGKTQAVLTGCFTPDKQSACGPTVVRTILAQPLSANDRTRVGFLYATSVSGIGPGNFTGTVRLENVHADGTITKSANQNVSFDVQPPAITGASATSASLGQYVILMGGGFVGGASNPDESTTFSLQGSFAPDDGSDDVPIDVVLVPEFRSGLELRYVLDEKDALGTLIDLRTQTGAITGMVQLIVEKGSDRVLGTPIPVQLHILPVKQIITINFLDEYISALRRFGLRAAEPLIRRRVLTVAARDYAGTNVEFRDTAVDDFALYSQVDISGPDPSGGHSFGFDNTPGKDTDNQRLYDRIGGVNAVTQVMDGVAGYGGVFLDSFFLFSTHPPEPLYESVRKSDLWQMMRNPLFDELFDPFRADRGGQELTASELETLAPPDLTSGDSCPADKGDRRMQAACAIFALGSMIGSTMTHECGHSLGLADPYGSQFHDPGDQPNRLMDSGGYRTFYERVELMGEGPARFCDTEFEYLQRILPSEMAAPDGTRPDCN